MTIFKYVDTAADGTGNGTTRAHTGANGAYASLSSARASLPSTLTEDVIILCAGATDDTTAVVFSGITLAGFTITILGDKGSDDSAGGGDAGTLFDDDGFYDGNLAYSDAHYRLVQSASFNTLQSQVDAMTVDGLQVHCGRAAAAAVGIKIGREQVTVINCRIGCTSGIGISTIAGSVYDNWGKINNNIVYVAGAIGIDLRLGAVSNTGNCYNNTVHNCATGIKVTDNLAGTINVKNNNVFNCTTEFSGLNAATTTVNATYNAGEGTAPTGHDSNWVQLNGTLTVDMVDPENATESLKNTYPVAAGALENAGIGSGTDANVPTVDIKGTSRSTTAPEIGAFELVTGGVFGSPWYYYIQQ